LIVVAIFMFVFQSSDNRCSSTFFSLVYVSIVILLTRISITNCKQSKWEREKEEISLVMKIANTMLIGRENSSLFF
jgi:hypothetical protein